MSGRAGKRQRDLLVGLVEKQARTAEDLLEDPADAWGPFLREQWLQEGSKDARFLFMQGAKTLLHMGVMVKADLPKPSWESERGRNGANLEPAFGWNQIWTSCRLLKHNAGVFTVLCTPITTNNPNQAPRSWTRRCCSLPHTQLYLKTWQ